MPKILGWKRLGKIGRRRHFFNFALIAQSVEHAAVNRGVTIWSGYCPEGMAVAWYSFIYNGSYMAVELILTVIGLIAIGKIINLKKKTVI